MGLSTLRSRTSWPISSSIRLLRSCSPSHSTSDCSYSPCSLESRADGKGEGPSRRRAGALSKRPVPGPRQIKEAGRMSRMSSDLQCSQHLRLLVQQLLLRPILRLGHLSWLSKLASEKFLPQIRRDLMLRLHVFELQLEVGETLVFILQCSVVASQVVLWQICCRQACRKRRLAVPDRTGENELASLEKPTWPSSLQQSSTCLPNPFSTLTRFQRKVLQSHQQLATFALLGFTLTHTSQLVHLILEPLRMFFQHHFGFMI
eukprot:118075-Hanusia_phi.AAC.1